MSFPRGDESEIAKMHFMHVHTQNVTILHSSYKFFVIQNKEDFAYITVAAVM